jgi:hypothetical protein
MCQSDFRWTLESNIRQRQLERENLAERLPLRVCQVGYRDLDRRWFTPFDCFMSLVRLDVLQAALN